MVQWVIWTARGDVRMRGGRAFEGGQHHVDCHLAIGVEVWLDAMLQQMQHERIRLLLRQGEVAVIRWVAAGIGIAA